MYYNIVENHKTRPDRGGHHVVLFHRKSEVIVRAEIVLRTVDAGSSLPVRGRTLS